MTAPARWIPGPHHGLAWPRGVALLDGSTDSALAEAVWSRLDETADLARFFAVLLQESGSSLHDLPSFAVAVTSTDHCHLAVRGEFEAVVGESGEQTVSGSGVITWSEARVPLDANLRLLSSGAPTQGQARPLGSGIVPAFAIHLGSGAGDPEATPLVARREAGSPAVVPDPPAATKGLLEEVFGAVSSPSLEPLTPTTYDPPPATEAPVTLVGSVDESPTTRSASAYAVAERDPADHQPDPPPAEAAAAEQEVEDFGELWSEHTVMRPVEGAAVRPGQRPTPGTPAAPHLAATVPPTPPLDDEEITRTGSVDLNTQAGEPTRPERPDPIERADASHQASPRPQSLGDHDGHTVVHSRAPLAPRTSNPAPASADTVLALVCSSGHANPVTRPSCRVCGTSLSSAPRHVHRSSVGRLRTSDGEVVELTGSVIVGREPRASRFQGTDIPRLLPIAHAHVSGSHLELRVHEWAVMAVDLRSTNGTYLRRAGDAPCRLEESPVPLQDGDVLDLGHGVRLTLEELA